MFDVPTQKYCVTHVYVCIDGRSATHEHVDNIDSPTSSSGSDVGPRSEFSQVKLHAQNQIILSKVLSEEREQVCMYVCT